MKVLFVMAGPADPRHIPALERRFVPLFRLLSGSGVELHIALLGNLTGLRERIEPSVEGIYGLPPLPPSLRGAFSIPSIAWKLRKIVHEVGPSIVEGSEPLPSIAASIAARVKQRPVVLYRRHHPEGRRRLLLASRVAARLADRTVVSSDTMAAVAAVDDRVPRDHVLVARSGTADIRPVTSEEVVTARERLGIPPGAKVVGTITRLRYEKGIDVLLEAFDRIHPVHAHLLVIGSGPEETYLREAARTCRNPTHFVGYQNDVDLWLRICDVIAIPSRRESFGRTTVEGMSAGRPLVASSVGGLVEAVEDGVTGFLVPPEKPEPLADALTRLITDDHLRNRMGAAARERFEQHHTLEAMAASWRSVWDRVACDRPHVRRFSTT